LTKTFHNSNLTYAKTGIDRKLRARSQTGIQAVLAQEANGYKLGKPVRLPFGSVFPIPGSSPHYYDLQIEGVGTKTLLAELVERYDTIGIDGVAMAVNDVLRSGADPVLVSDGIHISRSDPKILGSIIFGVRRGAEIAGSTLASGETGDVPEILHNPIARKRGSPFDLFVSCLGILDERDVVWGQISPGDHVIGLESSGIHSNGLTLARKILLKKWGGKFDPFDVPPELHRPLIEELLEPTRIYAKEIKKLKREGIEIKAALHITGDGLGKFRRLLSWRRSKSELGLRLKLNRKPAIFELILETAKRSKTPVSVLEMFRTFNMGVGFAVVLSGEHSSKVIDSLNNDSRAEVIGLVSTDGRISVESPFTRNAIFL
jgi:phosphoribosylformylglycinamidine cyclo-ligase